MATTTRKRTQGEIAELRQLERRCDYDELIAGLRERVEADRRVLSERWVKGWCGRRWRDIFLTEASADQAAVRVATRSGSPPGIGRLDPRAGRRPVRRRLAERFLFRDQEDWQLELPEPKPLRRAKTTLVFCPGLVSTLVPAIAFGEPFPALKERHGLKIVRARSHPVRGCEANVADLLEAVDFGRGLDAGGEEIKRPRKPGDVLLLGYSKGTPDALTMLVERPDLAPRVKALVCWAGAVGGSYVADGIDEMIHDLDLSPGRAGDALASIIRVLLPVARLERLADRSDEWDLKGAVRDLTTTERAKFLRKNRRALEDTGVPIFNVATVAAPLEVPYFQLQGSIQIAREEGDNDMQLSIKQSCMPGPLATTLAVLRGHHWDVAYDPFPRRVRLATPNLDHPFPRTAALAATTLLLAELGLLD